MTNQSDPTVARTVEIKYGGERRVLKFGLLAMKVLGMNPFDPITIEAFRQRQMDLGVASEVIAAGLRHEYYGKGAPRRGQEPPSPDDVLADMSEIDEFVGAFKSIDQLFGEDEDAPKPEANSEPANPPTA